MLWRAITIEPIGVEPFSAVMVARPPSVLAELPEPFGVVAELVRDARNPGRDPADPHPDRIGEAASWAQLLDTAAARALVRVYQLWRAETGPVFGEELGLQPAQLRQLAQARAHYVLQLYAYWGRSARALTDREVLDFLASLPRPVAARRGRVSAAEQLRRIRDAD